MKVLQRKKQNKLSCAITCPCRGTANKEISFHEMPIPNSLEYSSFNQENNAEFSATCSTCNRPYTIEVYIDNKNVWVQVWDDTTAELMPDESVNLIQ